jgi:hypothetical protein
LTLKLRQASTRAIMTSLYSLGINKQSNSNSDYLISLIPATENSTMFKVNGMSILE